MKPRALLAWLCVLALFRPAAAEQLWLTQSVSYSVTNTFRVNFSNTAYTEHERHFSNEEAVSFRCPVATGWSAGGGITWSQDKAEKTWRKSGRPTENVSIDYFTLRGGWSLYDANRLDLKFREGERDWVVYRNIGSLTAPPVLRRPWSPRPYLTEQFYFSARECFTGLDRFCQFRFGGGVRLNPAERFFLSVYWQYRDIERVDGDWFQQRVAGVSASLVF